MENSEVMTAENQLMAEETPTTSNIVDSKSIGEFARAYGYSKIINFVKVNINGYPFMNLTNSEGVVEPFYFSIKAAEDLEEGAVLSNDQLKRLKVTTVRNAEGELRNKLSFSVGEEIDLLSL